ncbi:protein-s-isoprenylcysteine O-methyltransferase [Ramaria rubella]|nr:protein-s-isoprenylcysteine O-methyltransferase [Ramaria rubella]
MNNGELDAQFETKLRQRVAARNPLETIPLPGQNQAHGTIPNTPFVASLISFSLGSVFALSLTVFLSGGSKEWWWATYQLGFFFVAWSAFHWGEFAVTAGWNLEKCSVDSFLLNNGAMYHVAHSTAILEYITTLYFKPVAKSFPFCSQAGIVLTLVGQVLRSSAMIHASTNFSHPVAYAKQPGHQLVTDGIYGWLRHPSYTGFFYWAIGTQLVLQNPICFVLYSIILWRFFYYRIRSEERALIQFFGDDYVTYRRKVGTLIPFIP